MSDKSNTDLPFCFIYSSRCKSDKCPVYPMIPPGEECAIGMDSDSLMAVQDAMTEAARYIDRHLKIDKDSGVDLLTQVREAIDDGKIEWAGIMEDLAKLDS